MPSRSKMAKASKDRRAEKKPWDSPWLWPVVALGVLLACVVAFGPWSRKSTEQSASAPPSTKPEVPPVAIPLKPVTEQPLFNVLLLTVDALRPDYLGCYGGSAVPTPAIDGLASESTRFEKALTPVPLTLPSHASIMTGLYPVRHGVRDEGMPLSNSATTLAETLKSSGYSTAAFVGSLLLDHRFGLVQGFDTFDQSFSARRRFPGFVDGLYHRPADQTVDAALRWLEGRAQAPEPFFLWVHLFDAQSPYLSPDPHATTYKQQPYLGAVAFLDEQIGRLLTNLRKADAWGRTIVVLVGSHGQGLMEHGEANHGYLLHDTTLAVPLIWRQPGRAPASVPASDVLASTLDCLPTLLSALQIPAPRQLDGRDLFSSAAKAERVVLAETLAPKLRHGWAPLMSARGVNGKFVHGAVPEYFNLDTDPKEATDLTQTDPSQVDGLLAMLREEQKKQWGTTELLSAMDLAFGANALAALKAGGLVADLPPPSGPEPDVKYYLPMLGQHAILSALVGTGRFEDALTLGLRILGETSRDSTVHGMLGLAYEMKGQWDDCIASQLRAVTLNPWGRHWIHLGRALEIKGQTEMSDICFRQMQSIDPGNGEVILLMGRRDLNADRIEEAKAKFVEAGRKDPYRQGAASQAWMGDAFLAQGKGDEAEKAYQAALAIDPANLMALEGMAGVEQRRGRVDAEADYLRRMGRVRPSTILYANRLSRLLASLDRRPEAVAVMKDYLDRNPGEVAAMGNLGNAYLETGQYHEAIAQYQKALEAWPEYATARFNLAIALARIDDVQGAIEQFRKVLELRPDHSWSSQRLLLLLVKENQLDEALAEVERAASRGILDWAELGQLEDLAPITGNARFQEIKSRYPEQKNRQAVGTGP